MNTYPLTPEEREYVEELRGWAKAQELESSRSADIIDRLAAEVTRLRQPPLTALPPEIDEALDRLADEAEAHGYRSCEADLDGKQSLVSGGLNAAEAHAREVILRHLNEGRGR